MSFIKRVAVFISIFVVSMSSMAVKVLAQNAIRNPVSGPLSDLQGSIEFATSWVRPIGTMGFIGMLIYGGYTYMTAGADPEKTKQAIMIIRAAVIGFSIIILAPLIVGTLGAILGVDLLV